MDVQGIVGNPSLLTLRSLPNSVTSLLMFQSVFALKVGFSYWTCSPVLFCVFDEWFCLVSSVIFFLSLVLSFHFYSDYVKW